MDRIEPLVPCVNAGEYVWELELLGQDQWFDVIDVRCLVGFVFLISALTSSASIMAVPTFDDVEYHSTIILYVTHH